ncbi:MAG: PqqD family peptide modification chaperone [Chromatiaceae bacterium]
MSTSTTILTLASRVRQHPDQIAAEADGEVLMMHVESGNYYGLDEVASFIWSRLETPPTIGELCAAIQAEFDVDEERCVADTLNFLQGMIADGLAQVVGPTGDRAGAPS